MSYIHKFTLCFVINILFLLLCGCNIDTNDMSDEISLTSQESDTAISSNVVSDEADVTEADNATHNVILCTDKTEYTFDETLRCEMRSESENEYFAFKNGPDYAFVQYWSSDTNEWSRCEKEYVSKDIGLEGLRNNYTVSFTLSERADKGKEKYRVGMEFSWGTFYSNEFTIKE